MGKNKALAGGQSKTNTSCYVQARSLARPAAAAVQQCMHLDTAQALSGSSIFEGSVQRASRAVGALSSLGSRAGMLC